MTDLQIEQHRAAWRAVVEAMPGSEFISHGVDLDGGEECSIQLPAVVELHQPLGCPTCGDQKAVVGLTIKCRDWHEVCRCGARYDQPKNPGCRRRKHPKKEGKC